MAETLLPRDHLRQGDRPLGEVALGEAPRLLVEAVRPLGADLRERVGAALLHAGDELRRRAERGGDACTRRRTVAADPPLLARLAEADDEELDAGVRDLGGQPP